MCAPCPQLRDHELPAPLTVAEFDVVTPQPTPQSTPGPAATAGAGGAGGGGVAGMRERLLSEAETIKAVLQVGGVLWGGWVPCSVPTTAWTSL